MNEVLTCEEWRGPSKMGKDNLNVGVFALPACDNKMSRCLESLVRCLNDK